MLVRYRAQQGEGQPDRIWKQSEIGAGGLCLSERVTGELVVGEEDSSPIATLQPHRVLGSTVAVLVIAKSSVPVLVDGYPPLPVSLLSDQSELIVGRHVLRYSAFQQPRVSQFSETDPEDCCVTCTQPFVVGDEILRCSSCQAPRHEGKLATPGEQPLLCASYAAQCNRCGARQDVWSRAESELSAPGGAPASPSPSTRRGN